MKTDLIGCWRGEIDGLVVVGADGDEMSGGAVMKVVVGAEIEGEREAV